MILSLIEENKPSFHNRAGSGCAMGDILNRGLVSFLCKKEQNQVPFHFRKRTSKGLVGWIGREKKSSSLSINERD